MFGAHHKKNRCNQVSGWMLTKLTLIITLQYVVVVVVSLLSHVRLAPHGLYSPPGSSVHGILQTRILFAIIFSKGSSHPGIKPASPAQTGGLFTAEPVGKHFVVFCCAVLSHSVMSNSLRPHGLQPPRLLCPRGLPGQKYWSGWPCSPPGDLPNPEIKPRSPTFQADSLQSESTGKPKNTGMGSLSLLQENFQTQELNWGILHCRQILYQLSYQGIPLQYIHILNHFRLYAFNLWYIMPIIS